MKTKIQICNTSKEQVSKMNNVAIRVAFIYILLVSQFVFPQDGSLDTSFDFDGIVTTNIGNAYTNATAIQADGKIVTVGESNTGNGYDFLVVRYNTNGSLDTSFGINGKVITNMGSNSDFVNDVVIQDDGKIIVIGSTYVVTNDEMAIVRYNTDGSLDTTFDFDGKLIINLSSGDDFFNSVKIQPNGKIVIVGSISSVAGRIMAILRFNSNGSLDTTFDNDGIVTTDINLNDSAKDVVIQLDGKIVVTGTSLYGINLIYIALVRYNSNGSLDLTFDNDGIVISQISSVGFDIASSIALQADGKIVVAGNSDNGSNEDIVVLRYNTNGSLDTTFDNDGYTTLNVSNNDYLNSMAIQQNGKIVLVGYSNVIGAFVLRYNTNGSLDTTFDIDGIVTTAINSSYSANDIAFQTDGKIVAVGSSFSNSTSYVTVVRYNNTDLLPNDNCNTATTINAFPYNFNQINGVATSSGFVSCNSFIEMNDGEWYSFIGNGNNVNVTLTDVQSNYDPKIGIYTGACGALNCELSADLGYEGDGESITIPNTIVGTTYYICIGNFSTFNDNPEGNFTINVNDVFLVNDDCVAAIQITSFPYTFIETNGMQATNNGGNNTTCSDGMNDGEWFRFIGNGANVTIALTNVWSTYDPQIGVYTGNCFGLSCVNTQDNGFDGGSETLTIPTMLGVNYYINIGHYSATTNFLENDFTITVTSQNLSSATFEENTFKAYPNPVHDILFIESPTTIKKVTIYNLLGQEVLANTNETLTQIDISSLNKGSYLVKISSDKGEKTIKIIKN